MTEPRTSREALEAENDVNTLRAHAEALLRSHPDKVGHSENLVGPFPCPCYQCAYARRILRVLDALAALRVTPPASPPDDEAAKTRALYTPAQIERMIRDVASEHASPWHATHRPTLLAILRQAAAEAALRVTASARPERASEHIGDAFLTAWDKSVTPPASAPQETLRRPLVGVAGRFDITIAQHLQRLDRLLFDEQAKINPDNALIAALCDAVRLTREHVELLRQPASEVAGETPQMRCSFCGSASSREGEGWRCSKCRALFVTTRDPEVAGETPAARPAETPAVRRGKPSGFNDAVVMSLADALSPVSPEAALIADQEARWDAERKKDTP